MHVNSKEITEKLTFREKKAVILRLMKEIYLLAPNFIVVTIFRQLLGVSVGYIAIYISTMILNGLQEGAAVRSIS